MERKPYSGAYRRTSAYPESVSGSRYSDSTRRPVSRDPYRAGNNASGSARRPVSDPRRASSNGGRRSGRPPVNYKSQRRPARRRPKLRFEFTKANLILIAILIAVLAVLIYVGSAWFTTTANRATYCTGVYVNDVDMTDFSKEDGKVYIDSLLEQRMNTGYTLSGGGYSYNFTPAEFCTVDDSAPILDRAWNIGHVGNIFDCSKSVRQLKDQPLNFEVAVKRDDDAVEAFIDRIYNEIYIAPINAEVVVDLNAPILTGQSVPGREVDRETLRAQIDELLNNGEGSLELPIIELQPLFSSDQAAAGLDMIVEFSTDVAFRNYNSRYNVRKALSYFNGFCVHPGETVDFNEIVGERNENNGWMEATEYAANNTSKGYGGGVCQASSTLYNAVVRALGFESIIRREAHSMTVTYLDPSLDAAVTNTNRDFIFQNPTDNPIYIYTEVTKKDATVRIYGVRPEYRYDLVSVILHQDRKAVRKGYIEDTEGTYCYYTTDKPVLYKKGIPACESQSWLIAYDWETGAEVWRKQLGNDHYDSGTDIYWVGVHALDGSTTNPTST